MKNRKLIIRSFIISFIYVLLGTITVVVSFPKYQIFGFDYNHPLWLPLVIITLPVNILLFGLVMVEFSIFYILILNTTRNYIIIMLDTNIFYIKKNIKNK